MSFDNGALLIDVEDGRHGKLTFDVLSDDLEEALAAISEKFGTGYLIRTYDHDWNGVRVEQAREVGQLWKLGALAEKQEESEAFLAWVGTLAPDVLRDADMETAADDFSRALVGVYGDFRNFGYESMQDDFAKVPALEQFFDFEGYGRWLATDYTVCELSHGFMALFRKV